MIKAVRCDQPSFREVRFEEGFNIILAERTQESTDKDSRNGVGKTLLVEIIHFCLGAQEDPNKGLRIKELENWTFILDLILKGKEFTVYRNTRELAKVKIEGDFSDWPIKPKFDAIEKTSFLDIKTWNALLGNLMFDLPIETEKDIYRPSFRSLISYFIRRGIGAYQEPFRYYPQQRVWNLQVNDAFLLGLNWEYASEFQNIKDKKESLKNLKKSAEQELIKGFVGSLGELEAERVRVEGELSRLQRQLETFRVHPQYFNIQEDSNRLTKKIHTLTNEFTINQQIFNKYKENLVEEKDVSLDKIEQIYSDVGFHFPNHVKQRINQVTNFHKKLIKNRKAYLEEEIDRLSHVIEKLKEEIILNTEKRAEILDILNTHGALEEFTKLQSRASTKKQKLESIKDKIEDLKKIQEGESNLKVEQEELTKKARRDKEERREQIDRAIELFNRNFESLYLEPGYLSIDISNSGYKFNVETKRATSQGVGYMKVFCYDLMLTQLRTIERDKTVFLIHDSTIFDGVDERQIAKALELAFKESEKRGFQYICAMNSDNIPYKDFTDGFREKFNKSLRITFTDATEDGGLLGFRF